MPRVKRSPRQCRAHPIGGPLEDYRATADELARLIEHRWAIGVGDA